MKKHLLLAMVLMLVVLPAFAGSQSANYRLISSEINTSGKAYSSATYQGVSSLTSAGVSTATAAHFKAKAGFVGTLFDSLAPIGTITINEGDEYVSVETVTLTLSADDGGLPLGSGAQMSFSNDNETWSVPEAYAQEKEWTLSDDDGEKTVYVKFRDSDGNWSDVYSDTIIRDEEKPQTTISGISGEWENTDVTVTLTATDNAAGIEHTYYTTDGSDPTISSLEYTEPFVISKDGEYTIKCFSVDKAGNVEDVNTAASVVKIDKRKPSLWGTYPINGDYIGTQGEPIAMRFMFNDFESGIDVPKTKLFLFEDDITDQVEIVADGLSYILDPDNTKYYEATVYLEDNAGNKRDRTISFTLDPIIPEVNVDKEGGVYFAPFTATITLSEPGKIYYSTDGYPPYIGAENTTVVQGTTAAVPIEKTINLQFFGIDLAGNRSQDQSEIYYFNEIPDVDFVPTATYNAQLDRVELQWPAVASRKGYGVYRVVSLYDKELLRRSNQQKYPPPHQLQLNAFGLNNGYWDRSPRRGVVNWYAVTVIDQNDAESYASKLVAVEVPHASSAANVSEAINRAQTWIESIQAFGGYWGHQESTRMLATTQILNALQLKGIDAAWVRRALFYVRGHYADNTDYLARKIITLSRFGQKTIPETLDLYCARHTEIVDASREAYGWGVRKDFRADALSTALAMKAMRLSGSVSHWYEAEIRTRILYCDEEDSQCVKNEDGCYGFVPHQDTSVFVSALVYSATYLIPTYYQWIVDAQNADGSFGSGLIDTAAVLLWIPLDDQKRGKAQDYLVSQQGMRGNWGNSDPYVTGLCLEALLQSQ